MFFVFISYDTNSILSLNVLVLLFSLTQGCKKNLKPGKPGILNNFYMQNNETSIRYEKYFVIKHV